MEIGSENGNVLFFEIILVVFSILIMVLVEEFESILFVWRRDLGIGEEIVIGLGSYVEVIFYIVFFGVSVGLDVISEVLFIFFLEVNKFLEIKNDRGNELDIKVMLLVLVLKNVNVKDIFWSLVNILVDGVIVDFVFLLLVCFGVFGDLFVE